MSRYHVDIAVHTHEAAACRARSETIRPLSSEFVEEILARIFPQHRWSAPSFPAALHDLIPRPQLPPRFCHAEGHTCIAYLGRYESVQCDLPDSDSPSHCSSLVTCGADNTVRLFSGYDDEDATTIDKHNAEVTSLTVSLNHFATGSADHQVQVVTHRATLACMFSLRLGFY